MRSRACAQCVHGARQLAVRPCCHVWQLSVQVHVLSYILHTYLFFIFIFRVKAAITILWLLLLPLRPLARMEDAHKNCICHVRCKSDEPSAYVPGLQDEASMFWKASTAPLPGLEIVKVSCETLYRWKHVHEECTPTLNWTYYAGTSQ